MYEPTGYELNAAYVGEPRYEVPQGTDNAYEDVSRNSHITPEKPKSPLRQEHNSLRKNVLLGFTFAIIIGLLVVLVVQINLKSLKVVEAPGANDQVCNTSSQTDTSPISSVRSAKSCLAAREMGAKRDGIYQFNVETVQTEVFCDMTTDGGGWTLVASVHEANISAKCAGDDLWSMYAQPHGHAMGSTNWENEVTFGNVHKSTEADYKNPFYSTLNATDVMIWHAPAGASLMNGLKQTTSLRYRTTNGFLKNNGGNIRQIFNRYPLKIKRESRATKFLAELQRRSAKITAQIPDWHTYSYRMGRRDMIWDQPFSPWGAMISFKSTSCTTGRIKYEQEYRCHNSNVFMNSTMSSPFMFASVISNEFGEDEYFELNENAHIQRTTGPWQQLQNNVTKGNYKLQYKLVQVSRPPKPTACEYFFVISNKRQWRSIEPIFNLILPRPSSVVDFRARLDGTPSNVIMGYMLLSRSDGKNVTQTHATNVAKIILEAAESVTDLFNEIPEKHGLIAPVTFDLGSEKDIMNLIPTKFRSSVEPGYLQFRAFNLTGYPNALCPGIMVKSISPEYVCVGGLSARVEEYGTCGDFAGWQGRMDETVRSEYAHSEKEISSSILIFYR